MRLILALGFAALLLSVSAAKAQMANSEIEELLLDRVISRIVDDAGGIDREKMGSGLEMQPGDKINVLVEGLSDEAKEIGLNGEVIQSRVELQLRKNGIPITSEHIRRPAIVYVYCYVSEIAFYIAVEFMRGAFYFVGDDVFMHPMGKYRKDVMGTHGSSSQFLMNTILEHIDIFSNDFLEANESNDE